MAAVMDSPAYGVRNVQIVTTGTGEALPGPMLLRVCGVGESCPITGFRREMDVVPGGRRRGP